MHTITARQRGLRNRGGGARLERRLRVLIYNKSGCWDAERSEKERGMERREQDRWERFKVKDLEKEREVESGGNEAGSPDGRGALRSHSLSFTVG